MNFETIVFEKGNNIAFIRLNRPDRLNALNQKMINEMGQVMDVIAADESIGAVIITGNEKLFGAGADIKEIKGLNSPVAVHAFFCTSEGMFSKIENLNKPTIAAVCGPALGGGCELALACDIRIAAENALFGQPEIKIGVIPAGGGTQRLPRLVGIGRAKELLYSGDPIDAVEAFRIGLVNKVTSVEQLLPEAKKMAQKFVERPAFALKMLKSAINQGINMDLRSALSYEMRCFEILFSTEDQKEGMSAFVEKRQAAFKGK
jgi:enoyl-CoA hydratase